ncbi:hypothetical protein F2P56_023204 [Juglans regia]|uniref:Uncharacterized protein LOC108980946 isoform X2 n=2 Tax=Juglans regia TaxID=51240 RepID=A0A2I4DK68_JUGRE|nr:uncharacterized protein LOC108980946 isoform X2 [Juglans regia]XP_035550822.1 uncharacterized protein LOC108980946 isoform X2 [Juglans regia]KAF5459233.1 hypothetical protein F2P56_023204 [Juglans regia]
MGKRKRIPNPSDTQPPISSSPSSGTMPCSSGMELMSEEKPLHSVDSSELKTLASVLDITDGSMKLLNANPTTTVNHHQSLGRSMFLKRSRHYYAHQYSRRNSANHANASTSRGKENMGKEIFRPDRLRSSSLVMDAASSDAVKMVCGFCQKPLRRRPYFLGSRLSSGELSVVAVLVCGHVYHAECLEQRTCLDDKRDPPCPLCLGLLTQDCDSGGHE